MKSLKNSGSSDNLRLRDNLGLLDGDSSDDRAAELQSILYILRLLVNLLGESLVDNLLLLLRNVVHRSGLIRDRRGQRLALSNLEVKKVRLVIFHDRLPFVSI